MARKIKFAAYFPAIFLTILIVNTSVLAQDADPCGCNAVLRERIFSERIQKGDESARNELKSHFVSISYDQFQTEFSAGGGASYAGFGLNANTSKGDFESKQRYPHLNMQVDQYKESREEWHRLDLFSPKPCEHKTIIQDQIIHPAIGIEYVNICRDCREEIN